MSTSLLMIVLLAQAEDAAREFIARDRERTAALQTVEVHSTWTDFEEGKPTRRDRQILYLDELGRRRLKMESDQAQKDGTWVRHDQVPYEWDILFDGELTASMTFDPHKDRVGGELQPGEKGGFRGAQIFDGQWGPLNQRTPVTFDDGLVTRLEEALQNQQTIDVLDDTDSRVTLRFRSNEPGKFLRFEIDKTRGWVPTSIAVVNSEGKPEMQTKFEYAQTGTGIWYVRGINHRYLGDRSEEETPLRETRCEVTECKINDPEFDEEIFRISLAPDTAVWDSRYEVNYRIGDEQAFTDQFAALAEAARTAAAEADDGFDRTPIAPSRRAWVIFLMMNAVFIAAVLGWLVYRRIMVN